MIRNINFGLTANMSNTSPDQPAESSSTSSASKCAFSIYSRDIRFEDDYTSNYSFENTKFIKEQPLINKFDCNNGEPLLNTVNSSRLVRSNTNDNNNEIKHFNHNLNIMSFKKKKSKPDPAPIPKPFIDNLHNYSKSCYEAVLPTNQKYEDDEDEDEYEEDLVDDGNQPTFSKTESKLDTISLGEVDCKLAPEHHARRPMNAFLIFCKRHRGIVREKYPNLENR